MGSHQQKRAVGQKFVIGCDGTWMNSDQGYDTSLFSPPTAQIPTNVTRIVRAVKHKDAAGIPQIVFYQRGIGANGDVEDKELGGLTGAGLSEHVREAYGFLANNFNPESQTDINNASTPMDEIVLLGFSRGAFTARAIASLISDIGLLTRIGMESFWGIFGDWMKQNIKGRESEWYESQYNIKIPFTDPSYRQSLIENGLTRWPIPIRAVGVWDTVGALGIPLPFKEQNVKAYSFVNTKVAKHVEHAFHAIALDEHRNFFTPTLWEQPDDAKNLKTLNQVWFPGVHSNVGGSYPDAGISNISLAWMISQLEDTDGGILTFDPTYLDWLQDMNNKYYAKGKEDVRPWGLGELYNSAPKNSVAGILQGLKPITRTPGRYHEIDDQTGKETSIRLRNTNESIHPSVRVRIDGGGRGTDEDTEHSSEVLHLLNKAGQILGLTSAQYSSAALSNYELVRPLSVKNETDHARAGPSGVYWKAKDGLESLPEAELGRTEIRLLKRSVEMAKV
ncbi:Uncharacterized protein LSUE1_G002421 [Lachnellula suecica]|uniref:T6SS Phospholipase effector Tle1-like catalytic domain-containing protein n=1 Tax=Lachnellula suecica TaxID=602035 RepID=A0A8T9CE75_9HELO|nr:Uncharacterized protein LSUE1_G002421 [Lachnellula suecica]